jgi:hypothetical protein
MKHPNKKVSLAGFLSVVFALAVLGCAPDSTFAQSSTGKSAASQMRGVRMDLAGPARLLGDRLRKPGKERVVMTGTLVQSSGAAASVTLVRELAGNVRIEKQGGKGPIVFNPGDGKAVEDVGQDDEGLLESLAYDWPDQLFVAHGDGTAMRLVVPKAQLRQNGKLTGQFYDIYEVRDEIQTGKTTRMRSAHFWLNSDTDLLERVLYRSPSGRVVVKYSQWAVIEGQRIPGRVERLVDGKPSFTLTFTSAAFAASDKSAGVGQN